jgi:hypothetical protein
MATHTNWFHSVRTNQKVLPQLEHLQDCISNCGEFVTLIEPFELWKPYENSTTGQLRLYAQTDWKHIDEIVNIIDQQNSTWVYIAINRYLLTGEPDATTNNDYDQAIVEYVNRHLKNYTVIDYQYQQLNYTGNVGNFVSPDNRMLCKRT